MALKPFERWNWEEVNLTFGYARIYTDFQPLSSWLNAVADIPKKLDVQIEFLRERLAFTVDGYNEDELKMQFIAPILHLVDFNKTSVYRLFSQRKIGALVQLLDGTKELLSGRVEALVAQGVVDPRHPYFFIHEYKPFKKTTPSDPLGQLVAAMIVAQVSNNDDKPIYGLYVMGQYWYFVVLNGKEYAQSKAFDATKIEELRAIMQTLFWLKNHIEHRIDTENLK